MYQIYVEIWEATKSSRKVLIYRMCWQLKIYVWIFLITLGCYVVLNTSIENDKNEFSGSFRCDNRNEFLSSLKASFVNPEAK